MRTKLAATVVALTLLAAVPLLAHHSFASEYDNTKVLTLTGKMVNFEWVNPHSWFHMDVKDPDGTVVNWMVEGGSPNALLRLGFTKNAVLPGMEILVEGYQAKDATKKAVGKSLMFADGRKLFLGGSEPGGRGGSPGH